MRIGSRRLETLVLGKLAQRVKLSFDQLRIAGRKQIERLFRLPNPNSSRVIEIQRYGGRPADRAERHNAIIVPSKMVAPAIRSWIEERNALPAFRIRNLDTVRLAQVAARARPRQILRTRIATARPRHNVLDVESSPLQRLMHATVLAPPVGALADLTLDCLPRGHFGVRPSR